MTDISLLRYLREVLKEISESSDIEQIEDEVAEALKEVEARIASLKKSID